MTISSIRSCSQNTEPVLETKRRKLTAVMGMESWSRVESSLPAVFLGDDGAGLDETDSADVKTAWVRFMEALEVRFDEGELSCCCVFGVFGVVSLAEGAAAAALYSVPFRVEG
jgi:hypothetical protein